MCVLRVTGDVFDAAAYVATSTFRACKVFERGTPKRPGKPDLHPSSGFYVGVSDAPWSDLDAQCRDALAFLVRHRKELEGLKQSGAVTVELDFPTEASPEGRHVTLWGGAFPPGLLWAAGSMGISIRVTLYVATRRKDDPPATAN